MPSFKSLRWNTRRTPERISGFHLPDQIAHFAIY
jgi:hypothetical protein